MNYISALVCGGLACLIGGCINGCAPKLPSQNHTQESITLGINPSKDSSALDKLDSSIVLESSEQSEVIDSSQMLAIAQNHSQTLRATYNHDENKSAQAFEARLEGYYDSTSNQKVIESLVAIAEVRQLGKRQCDSYKEYKDNKDAQALANACLIALDNAAFSALDFLQNEGIFLRYEVRLQYLDSSLESSQASLLESNNINALDSTQARLQATYGNGVVLIERKNTSMLDSSALESSEPKARTNPRFYASFDGVHFVPLANDFESITYFEGKFLGITRFGEIRTTSNLLEWQAYTQSLSFSIPAHIDIKSSGGKLFVLADSKDLFVLYSSFTKALFSIHSLDDVYRISHQYLLYGTSLLDSLADFTSTSALDSSKWQVSSDLRTFEPLKQNLDLVFSGSRAYVRKANGIYRLKNLESLANEQFFVLPYFKDSNVSFINASNEAFLAIKKPKLDSSTIASLLLSYGLKGWNEIAITQEKITEITHIAHTNGVSFLLASTQSNDTKMLRLGDGIYRFKLISTAPFVPLYAEPKTSSQILAQIPLESSYEIKALRKIGRFYEVEYSDIYTYDNHTLANEEGIQTKRGFILDTQGLPLL